MAQFGNLIVTGVARCLNTLFSNHLIVSNTISLGRKSDSTKAANSSFMGYEGDALANQTGVGHYNNTATATASASSGTGAGTSFVIGNGTSDAASNAFRVTDNGEVYAKSSSISTGADYAEYFEWADGNPDNEDRRGLFVTLKDGKLEIAHVGDYILGVTSSFPSVIGNGDEEWRKRWLFDDFGSPIIETFEYKTGKVLWEADPEDETKMISKEEVVTGTRWKENPDYDPSQTYIPRSQRKEWIPVGMMGVVTVHDNGRCVANGYCSILDGFAVPTENRGYFVIKRISDDLIQIVIK